MLTKAQEALLVKAVGNGISWPDMTVDPAVNYEIERRLDDEHDAMPDWENLPEEEKYIYIDEARQYASSLPERSS